MRRNVVRLGITCLFSLSLLLTGCGPGDGDGEPEDASPDAADTGVADLPALKDVAEPDGDEGIDPGVVDVGVDSEEVEEDTYAVGPPCTEADEEPCSITNEHGSCAGEILCLGDKGLAPCSARTPSVELCNAIDDDCDGETDEDMPLCDCGDGTCAADGGETVEICPCDCSTCGDGLCSPCGESPTTCREDCCLTPEGPSVCGDGYCLGYGCGENPKGCPEDCGTSCGDGECEGGENPFGCPEDCKRGECGNDICEPTDGGPFACPEDCAATCGDCVCEKDEGWMTCPLDCGYCGDGICAECPNLDAVGWYGGNSTATYEGAQDCSEHFEGASTCGPQPVARKMANEWGLYDTAGNLWEWVWDSYTAGAYSGDPVADPIASGDGPDRVARGGNWNAGAYLCRVGGSSFADQNHRTRYLGFRPARTVPAQ